MKGGTESVQIKKLKANQIAKLPDGKYLDGNGLYLRVEGNSRRWFLRFRFEGKRHDLGMGRLSLTEARDKAAALRQEIADGRHPLVTREIEKAQKKREAIAAKGLTLCLEDIYEDALKHHVEVNALRYKGWLPQATSFMRRIILPAIGKKPLGAMTPVDVADVLRPMWTTTTGSRALTYIRACFKYAALKGWFAGMPPTQWENCLELHLPKQSKVTKVTHFASCPWQDVPKLYQQFQQLPDSPKKRVVLATILCVPRIGEFLSLKASEVDRKKRIITILVSKTSTDPWQIPYPKQVDKLFDFTAEWPFGRTVSKVTITDLMKPTGYTIHGFRASFSSWCADHEKNPETREACLHHSLGGKVTLSYQRSDLLELRRKLLQEWADYVTGTSSRG